MRQLDPKAVWLLFISFFVTGVVPIAFASVYATVILFVDTNAEVFAPQSIIGWLVIIIPLFAILCFVWAKLTYHFYRYELTEAGFRKELGVISKTYVTIPYDRIQNVDIYRGIVARLLGLSDLNIQTAGMSSAIGGYRGSGSEGRLFGLSKAEAEQLRDELIQRARRAKDQGL